MNVCGIIAEYNPFHRGHEYQFRYARETLGADYLIVAMSGDFVQRGTPALFEKRLRTRMALAAGADLVLELPVRTATASAEGFASGGVALLSSLGVVSTLCFGSEAGDTDALLALAEILVQEPEEYRIALRRELQKGASFPAARETALTEYLQICETADSGSPEKGLADHSIEELSVLLSSPNNLLGIEYCKAILRQHSALRPEALRREGSGYHAETISPGELPSASYLRQRILAEGTAADPALTGLRDLVPEVTLPYYMEGIFHNRMLTESDLDLLLRCRLLTETRESLGTYLDLSEALADRILRERNRCEGFASFTQILKTREVTQTRIQRALLHLLLGLSKEAPELAAPYARILGFRREASPLIRSIRENSSVPLLQKASDFRELSPEAAFFAQEDLLASNLCETLLSHKTKQAFRHEYEKPVVIL